MGLQPLHPEQFLANGLLTVPKNLAGASVESPGKSIAQTTLLFYGIGARAKLGDRTIG